MKRQIRTNVFETNSSSVHSLVIRTDSLLKDLEEEPLYTEEEIIEELQDVGYLDKAALLFQPDREEDWYYERFPFRVLSSFSDKLKYMTAYRAYDRNWIEMIQEILKELIPSLLIVNFPLNMYANGFPRIKKYEQKEALKNFLINRKYIIICDGDEYCVWEDFVDSGLIDGACVENFEEIK